MVHSFPTRRSSDHGDQAEEAERDRDAQRDVDEGRQPDLTRSEEHTSELQSHHPISYAVFCSKKKSSRTILIAPRTAVSSSTTRLRRMLAPYPDDTRFFF